MIMWCIDQQKGTLQRAQCELNARFESTASEPKPYSTLQKDHSAADPARVKQSGWYEQPDVLTQD